MSYTPDIDDILESLKITKDDSSNMRNIIKVSQELTKEDWVDVVLQYKETVSSLNDAISNAKDMLEEARDLAKQAGDSDYLESYSSVVKALSELFKTKTSLVNEFFRITSQNKMKDKDIEARKELEKLKMEHKLLANTSSSGATVNIQNNFQLKAPRDVLFDAIFSTDEDIKTKAQDQIKMLNDYRIVENE